MQKNAKTLLHQSRPDGAGLPLDHWYTVTNARFTYFLHMGSRVPTLELVLTGEEGNARGRYAEYYAIGNIEFTEDGRSLTSAPLKSSNFGILMAALSNADFPGEQLRRGDINCLIGFRAYWVAWMVKTDDVEYILPVPSKEGD